MLEHGTTCRCSKPADMPTLPAILRRHIVAAVHAVEVAALALRVVACHQQSPSHRLKRYKVNTLRVICRRVKRTCKVPPALTSGHYPAEHPHAFAVDPRGHAVVHRTTRIPARHGAGPRSIPAVAHLSSSTRGSAARAYTNSVPITGKDASRTSIDSQTGPNTRKGAGTYSPSTAGAPAPLTTYRSNGCVDDEATAERGEADAMAAGENFAHKKRSSPAAEPITSARERVPHLCAGTFHICAGTD
jgi:hypothetical protein